MKPYAIIGALGVLLAGSLYMNVSAQESGPTPSAVAMTGDSKAAWILPRLQRAGLLLVA